MNPDSGLRGGTIWELSYREAMQVSMNHFAREYIIAILKKHKGNVTRAALHAGIERGSLHRLMRKYGVQSTDFRDGGV